MSGLKLTVAVPTKGKGVNSNEHILAYYLGEVQGDARTFANGREIVSKLDAWLDTNGCAVVVQQQRTNGYDAGATVLRTATQEIEVVGRLYV